jgi:hypothetical protein
MELKKKVVSYIDLIRTCSWSLCLLLVVAGARCGLAFNVGVVFAPIVDLHAIRTEIFWSPPLLSFYVHAGVLLAKRDAATAWPIAVAGCVCEFAIRTGPSRSHLCRCFHKLTRLMRGRGLLPKATTPEDVQAGFFGCALAGVEDSKEVKRTRKRGQLLSPGDCASFPACRRLGDQSLDLASVAGAGVLGSRTQRSRQ